METYKFGEVVTATHKLVREQNTRDTVGAAEERLTFRSAGRRRGSPYHEWVQHHIPPTEVRVIGVRSLRNGSWIDLNRANIEDDPCWVFSPEEYIKAALVVKNLKEKPFYIKLNA